MDRVVILRGPALALVLLVGCGERAAQSSPPRDTVAAGSETAGAQALEPPSSGPTLDVALRMLRPEVELVPELRGNRAGYRGAASAPDGERVRALHRFSLGEALHTRVGDVVFVATRPGGGTDEVATTFAWDLRTDAVSRVPGLARVERLFGLGLAALVYGEHEGAAPRWHLLGPGASVREAPAALTTLEDAAVIDGTSYVFRRGAGGRLELSRLASIEPLEEEAIRALADASVWLDEADGALWVLRLEGRVLEAWPPPFTTPVRIELGARAREIEAMRAGYVRVLVGRQRFDVELASRVVRPANEDEDDDDFMIAIEPEVGPRSLHELRLAGGGLLVRARESSFFLDARGARPIEPEDAPPAEAPSCACEAETLVCGTERIEAACLALPELATFRVASDLPPPTQIGDARFRIDHIEADLGRITRLSDGARLWIRIVSEVLVVQADDGAFWASSDTFLPTLSVRWGRSILEAPVTPLETHREALHRSTLVSAFFGGEPLPAARTTELRPR